ncbi:MAG: type IV secretory system conjugative DNA transfer family protein [Gemmataceae bacterium]
MNQRREELTKEGTGVISTLGRSIGWCNSEPVYRFLASSSFNPETDIRNSTIFFGVPGDMKESHKPMLRTILSSLLATIMRHGDETKQQVLILADEASVFNQLPILEEVSVRGRASGCRYAGVYQSDAQVKAFSPSQPTLLYDNCNVQLYFRPSGYETAKHISQMLGSASVPLLTANRGESRSFGGMGCHKSEGNQSWGETFAEHERPLLRPEEVLAMDSETLVAFLPDTPPCLVKRIKYYNDPMFNNGAEPFRLPWGLVRKPAEWFWGLILLAMLFVAWGIGLIK